MADLADMIQKLSFYQAGGKDPGTSTLDKINTGFGTVDKAITDVLAMKKAQFESQKLQSEKKKLDIGNTPIVESLGTPIIKSQIADAEAAPIPTEDLVSGVLNSRQAALDKIAQNSRDMTKKYGNLTTDQYKDMGAGYKDFNDKGTTPEDLRPLSQMMTFEAAKSVAPQITEEQYKTTTIGGLKQFVAAGKQNDLNQNRNSMRDAARDTMVLNLSKSIESNPFLNKLKEQDVGLDTTADIEKLVAEGNTVAAAALGIKEAKGLGEVGVMTEKDVTRYITSRQISQKAGDILLSWLRGTPTQATLQEIKEINAVIKNRLTTRINKEYGQYVDLLANNFDIPREEAARRLAITLQEPNALQTINPPPSGGAETAGVNDAAMKTIQQQLPAGAKVKSIKRID